jgi:hypothetical protein
MPLAFHSESHGTVAFGFFQIEIDMLLLERLFFFADAFCRGVVEILAEGHGETEFEGFRIEDPGKVGNLHGAIAGTDLRGFIGATYRRFPFPADPAKFKQNPEGAANRPWAFDLIRKYAAPCAMRLRREPESGRVSIGDYTFSGAEFLRLVEYVDRGGFPRWRDGIRPQYVEEMTAALTASR